mgnify:CR=1 FL=1
MAKKNKPRWKKLDMWERLARRCKQNGALEETVEHIREHGKQRMKEREKNHDSRNGIKKFKGTYWK